MQKLIDDNNYKESLQTLPDIAGKKTIIELLGMMPTISLGDIYDLNRLRELVEADKAGRCVVLPCKPGDKVYQQNGVAVYELEIQKLIFDCGYIAFDESAIGKTVFLTEPAAQAALEGGTPDAKAD